MSPSRIAIAILAAGRGSRFGGAKLLAPLAGRPLICHAVEAALASGVGPVSVVVSTIDTRLWWVLPREVELLANPNPAEGIASSLRAALAHLEPRAEIDAVCIGLGDQPLIGAEAYRRLAAAHGAAAGFAAASYGGEIRNPVLLARALWRDAMALTGDAGARQLMARHPIGKVPCDGTGDPSDVDTPADLSEIERRCSSTTSFE